MLRPGITENVYLQKAEMNDKGTLGITFAVGDSTVDSFDAAIEPESTTFLLFPFKNVSFDGQLLTAAESKLQISELKAQLTHILMGYMSSDKIVWAIRQNTPVTENNFSEHCTNEKVLATMYTNLCTQFIGMAKPFFGVGAKFRIKLVRQSATKHFSTFPKKFVLSGSPFYESMIVSTETSKLKFSTYEISKNLNDPTPVDAPAASTDNAGFDNGLDNLVPVSSFAAAQAANEEDGN